MFFRSLIRPRTDTRQRVVTFMMLNAAMVGTRYASVVVAFDNDFEKYVDLWGSATICNLLVLAYFVLSVTRDYHEMIRKDLSESQLMQVRLFYFSLVPRSMQFDNGYIHFKVHRDFLVIAFSKNESTRIKRAIGRLSIMIKEKYTPALKEVMQGVEPLRILPEFQQVFYFLQGTNGRSKEPLLKQVSP